MTKLAIRPATAADALPIAAIHCASWREVYVGVLDTAFLAGPIEQERRDVWLDRLNHPSPEQCVLVAELPGTGPVGFICLYRDQDARWGSLIDNIHVIPGLRGKAVGRSLMRAGAEALRASRAGPGVHLWVFEANVAARVFYERLGGREVERCPETEMPTPPDTFIQRVFWPDVGALIA